MIYNTQTYYYSKYVKIKEICWSTRQVGDHCTCSNCKGQFVITEDFVAFGRPYKPYSNAPPFHYGPGPKGIIWYVGDGDYCDYFDYSVGK